MADDALDPYKEAGLSEEMAKKALRVSKEQTKEYEIQRDLGKDIVNTFKRLNDAQDKSVAGLALSRQFAKEILGDVKARGYAYDYQNKIISEAEDALIRARLRQVNIGEEDLRLKGDISKALERQATATAAIGLAESKSNMAAQKRVELERAKANAQRDLVKITSNDMASLATRAALTGYIASLSNKIKDAKKEEKNANKEIAAFEKIAIEAKKEANRLTEERNSLPSRVKEDADNAERELRAQQKLLREMKLAAGYAAHMEDSQYSMLGPAGQYATAFNKLSKDVKVIPLQFMLLDQLIKLGIERFIALDQAAEKFRQETGFSVTQMATLRKEAEAINKEFVGMGVSIEKVYESAKALAEVFGRTSLISSEALKNVSLMAVNLGVAAADSAEVLSIFQGIGGATEQSAMNVLKVGAGLSEKTGVSFKAVMNDIAKSSGTTAMLLGTNPSKLMKAAIAARALGTDLNKLAAQQEKLLNYTDSINNELEASALLGRSISFQRARQLAYEGKVEESAKATLDMVKQAGDFNEMNIYQRKALAAASGMELSDLTKMMAVEARRDAIMKGNDPIKKRQLEQQEAELKKLKERNKLDDEDLVKQNEKALAQEKIQGLMTQLNNLMDAMKTAFAEILEPIITPLVKLLVPVLKVVLGLVKVILWPFRALAEITTLLVEKAVDFGKKVEWMKELGQWISNAVDSMGKFYDKYKTVIDSVGAVAGGIMAYMFFGRGGFGKLMEMVKAPFNLVKDAAKGLVGRGAGAAAAVDAGKGAADAAGKTAEAAKATKSVPAGTGVKDFLVNLSEGLKAMGSGKVLFGALNLIPAAVGLVAMIPGAIGMAAIGVTGKLFEVGAIGLAAGLTALANPKVGLGALVILGLGAAFALFGLGAKLIADAFVSISKVIPDAIVPLTQLALLSPFLYVAAAGIGALAISLGLLAASTIPAAVASIAIFVVAKSVEKLGTSFEAVSKNSTALAKAIPSIINPIRQFTSINMKDTAQNMLMLSNALGSFGVGSAVAGIGSLIGNLLGGDPIAKMERLANISDKLKESAEAIGALATATSRFSAVDSFAKSVGVLADSLNKLTDSLGKIKTEELSKLSTIAGAASATTTESTVGTAKNNNSGIESKLDKLTELLVGGAIKVHIDGKLVSSAVANTAGR